MQLNENQVKAFHKNARISAQKARLVADQVRGMYIQKAIDLLTFSDKKAAGIIKKVVEAAIANAEHNEGLDIDTLKVQTIYIDKAASFKRFTARAKGRGNRIEKQNCHITVVLASKE